MEELLESGALAVYCHGLLNDLGVIGTAVRTLEERADALSSATRQQLVLTINETVDRGIERLRALLAAPAVNGTTSTTRTRKLQQMR